MKIAIVGGGVFGLAAALELANRRHGVTLYEAATIPADKAASRDISKALRLGYGPASALYAPAVMEARAAWIELERTSGRRIFHDVGGVQLVSAWTEGSFERQSFDWLAANGFKVRRIDRAEAERLLPWFRMEGLDGGYVDPDAGWLDPMTALPALRDAASAQGVTINERTAIEDPRRIEADAILVTAGAWVRKLLPSLSLEVRTTRQHEAMFVPPAAEAGRFSLRDPFWSLDLATQGWYGFPRHPEGSVKLARHVPDAVADPDGDRAPDPAQAAFVRTFIEERIPCLRGFEDQGRTCFYTMSPDGHFLFDVLPGHPRIFIAGTGSGHAFKFGPLLGHWAANLLESKPVPVQFRLASKTAGSRVV